MDKNQALQQFNAQIPTTGEVLYSNVENALRATSEGRAALRHFHSLRRSGSIVARIDGESNYFVSRPVSQGVING